MRAVTNHVQQEGTNYQITGFLVSQIFYIIFYVYEVKEYLKPLIIY